MSDAEVAWYSDTDPMVHADAPTREVSGSTPYLRLFDLAEGGMGRVELTVRRGAKFQRLYAVKRLHPAITNDPDARTMFLEEGRLAGLIHHPNVVGVLDVGEDRDGPYLVMEYVEGVTARDVVLSAKRQRIPLAVQICCRIAAQAARGLATAHSLSSHEGVSLDLVHRDISPHNILVGFDGIVRVADFGIARATGRDHRTSTGVLKGKLGYMAPEVLQFQKPDRRTDLFSLGVVLYELLAGRRLYGGKDDAERARRILNEPPPDIGEVRIDVPPEVQALLMSLLAKDPDDRPAETKDVADRLDQVVHALVELEGAHSLEDFVAEGFAEEQRERQRAIHQALEQLVEVDVAPTQTARRPRSAAKWVGAVAVVALLLLGSFGALAATRWDAPTQAASESSPRLEQEVSVTVQTSPPGALVEVAGLAPRRTPATFVLARSAMQREFTVALEGYATRSESFVPDESRRLEMILSQLDAPATTEPPIAASAPEAPTTSPEPPRRRPRSGARAPTKSRPASLDTYWGLGESE